MDITIVEGKDLVWNFSSKPGLNVPNGYWSSGQVYHRKVDVDPFPCYAHNTARAYKSAKEATARFPLDGELTLCVAFFEDEGRTNGWMTEGIDYRENDEKAPYIASIFLSGKRIPLHPAMTRYLVAHEYGHVVQYWLEKRFDAKDLMNRYKKMRGVEDPAYYGGRTWHASVGEVFANDFRIVGLEAEMEFWPHDVAYPAGSVVEFWTLAKEGKWQEALDTLPAVEATAT